MALALADVAQRGELTDPDAWAPKPRDRADATSHGGLEPDSPECADRSPRPRHPASPL